LATTLAWPVSTVLDMIKEFKVKRLGNLVRQSSGIDQPECGN
jgi:hypothetical protein